MEMAKHICPHCKTENKTFGDIGVAICKKCKKSYRTIPILKFYDIFN
jgi:ribosomal protein L37AE/L43A